MEKMQEIPKLPETTMSLIRQGAWKLFQDADDCSIFYVLTDNHKWFRIADMNKTSTQLESEPSRKLPVILPFIRDIVTNFAQSAL